MESLLLEQLSERGCAIHEMLEDSYMGREDFYVKVLKRLPESTAFERLRASVAAGDVNACFEAAHELKGLYATLGLTPALEIVRELVEIVRPLTGLAGVPELFARLEPLHAEFVALIVAA